MILYEITFKLAARCLLGASSSLKVLEINVVYDTLCNRLVTLVMKVHFDYSVSQLPCVYTHPTNLWGLDKVAAQTKYRMLKRSQVKCGQILSLSEYIK